MLATLVFAVLAKLVVEGHADHIDRTVALAVHDHLDSRVLDHVMITISQLSSGTLLVVYVAVIAIWFLRKGDERTASILIANGLAAEILNVVLKRYFERPRPTLFAEVALPESFSFPSGHAMSAMAVLGGLAAVLVMRHREHRTAIIAVTAVLVFVVGLSRVYLGVHWPFDVLAGFAAGVPLLVATVHLLHTRERDAITDADLPDLTNSDADRSRRTSPQRG